MYVITYNENLVFLENSLLISIKNNILNKILLFYVQYNVQIKMEYLSKNKSTRVMLFDKKIIIL